MKEEDIAKIAKEEASSAIERQAAFYSLKPTKDDVEKLRADAYMLTSRLGRLIEIVETYAKFNEYTFLRDLKESSLKLAGDCTRALVALDNIIKRGLL